MVSNRVEKTGKRGNKINQNKTNNKQFFNTVVIVL